ncbi:PfkB family carbohydrate kinase [Paenibacillus roseipurpureus]|uniref:PfkB family carbohydrate kinase n=1 Tax=Paenibacillus roseopurpureus TaxID=2918901 RepID=A0AA96LNV8_9BACL|nr:PfkB family carbohydrate kinase [Paenibacillus sp. MBLB1832]WNR45210.1 PfkB family carbohydrate kinase [Paenibacillus sp. MBLB1832]
MNDGMAGISGKKATKSTIVCLGELLIDFVPEENGQALADVGRFGRAAGGAPANVAAAVAKLGGDARFIGKIGRDPFGDYLVRTLQDVGVQTAVLQTDEAKTGLAFVSLRADGERDFLFFRDPAADMLLREDEVEPQWLEDAAVYHFGSVSLIAEPCRTATLDAARRAREFGALVSYDPNVRLALWPSADAARAEILAQLGLADVVKVSEEEIEFLLGVDATTGAELLLQSGPKVIVITLGAQGCRVVSARQDVVIPGVPVAAVDTTGAGDSFVGGMLFQLASLGVTPATIVDALAEPGASEWVFAFANRVGAITTTRRGAIPALPTLAEVEAVSSR